jgi:hypothetical protein
MRLFVQHGRALLFATVVWTGAVFGQTWDCGDAANDGGAPSVKATLNGGTLTVGGKGKMIGYFVDSRDSVPVAYILWGAYKDSIAEAVIGDGVTSIGHYAFIQSLGLTSVTISGSVDTIRAGAFQDCAALMSVVSLRAVPPIIDGANATADPFYGVNKSAACLYVPRGSVPAYSEAAYWNSFGCVKEMEEPVPADSGSGSDTATPPVAAPEAVPDSAAMPPDSANLADRSAPATVPDSAAVPPDSVNLADQGVIVAVAAIDTPTVSAAPRTPKGAKKTKRPDGLFGLGIHWGADFSVSMGNGGDALPRGKTDFRLDYFDTFNETVQNIEAIFNYNIKAGIQNIRKNPDIPPESVDSIVNSLIHSFADSIGSGFSFNYNDSTFAASDNIKVMRASFLKASRSGFERSALNFGGKLFVNVIPVIETIELSFNLGVWQYAGAIEYLDVDAAAKYVRDSLKLPTPAEYKYIYMPLTLKEYDVSFLGLEKTPYAKLQLDATLRRTVLGSRYARVSAGAGMSVHFSTPILSTGLIEDVKKKQGITSYEELVEHFIDEDKRDELGQAIVDHIIDEMFTPRYGAHLVAGAHLKFSAIGVYVDGKFMIPIGDLDDSVKNLNASGFLVNAGLSLSF